MNRPAAARRSPGRVPSLSQQQVVDAALHLMATDGLAAVSFRSVSRRLGVNPMALYTYVQNKDDLLAVMFDTIAADLRLDTDSTADPEQRLVDYYTKARAVLMANAELYRLVRTGNAHHDFDWTTSEQLCAVLEALGLRDAAVLETEQTLLQFTVGNALYWAALGAETLPVGVTMEAAERIRALDPLAFPRLSRLVALPATADPTLRFQTALRQLLRAAQDQP